MNIEMHGLPDDEGIVSNVGEAIWRQLIVTLPAAESRECAVTNVPSHSFNHEGMRVPFLRIYSDKKADFATARKLLKPIRLPGTQKKFVECVLLADCWEE
ncbi:hypothetical protein KGQ27_03170 [Patescibacteria group bacterium]|nr:hypothetical protein [Patescibacteria group bacterium]MDE1946734.1 hypothetical protein [Patescibacteria group bacterium]MDE2010963.1 hypothetical protein [Patescibacteria group bacterium]MDE2232806.1 hypothetical protein [Patescibacteria group bacterium]